MARPGTNPLSRLWHFLLTWLLRHAQVAVSSLGKLVAAPLATAMTVSVIGIALALPAGLHAILVGIDQLSVNWVGTASISLFLKKEIDSGEAAALKQRLGQHPGIRGVRHITPEEALAEFRIYSGFGPALDILRENPLPHLLVVEPQESYTDASRAQLLLRGLEHLPEVEMVQLDMVWIERFRAMVLIAHRAIWLAAGLLGLAVLLIVGNTIRLEIENRRSEIEISKLIGATDAFVRRPFLYSGIWYGCSGGLLAAILVTATLWGLAGPISELARLYASGFSLSIPAALPVYLVVGGGLLGFLGAWLAVGRHLSAIEPV